MFDDFSKRSKAVKAALDLAKERDWGDITLADIARAAGLSLADLRREFAARRISSAPSRPSSMQRCWPRRAP